MNRINNIIEKYCQNPDAELEIKVYLNSINEFQNKLKSLFDENTSYVFAQSVNIIGNVRKESTYVNGKKTSHVYVDKKLISQVKSREYKITLSHEHIIPDRKDVVKLIRLKNRIHILTDSTPGWRHDFTIVVTVLESDIVNIRKYISEYMKSITTIDEFYDRIPLTYSSNISCEYEIEHVGQMDTVDALASLVNTKVKSVNDKLISAICKKLNIFGQSLKDIISKPKQLNKNLYNKLLPDIHNYYLSVKADGERGLIYAFSETKLITMNSEYDIQLPDKFQGILDVEIIGDPAAPDLILIFDILFYKVSMIHERYEKRLSALSMCKTWPKLFMIKKNIRLAEYLTQIPELMDSNFIYPQDGLIFTENAAYDGLVYKWKPIDELTIDFLVLKPDSKVIGYDNYIAKKNYTIMFLYCGVDIKQFHSQGMEQLPHAPTVNNKTYFPIHFAPSNNPTAYIYYVKNDEADALDGHIAEFAFNYKTKELYIANMRPDKDILYEKSIQFGNDFRIAELTYMSYSNPLTLDDLTNTTQGYFKSNKSMFYKPMIQFNSFVKAQVLRQLHSFNHIVDLAAGKGQDMFIYHGYQIKKVTFVDIDEQAIEELNNRKYELGRKDLHIYEWHPKLTMAIQTIVADVSKMEPGDIPVVDGIVMNLALHYIIKDKNSISKFIHLISKSLKPGGIFIFTCFNGRGIQQLLTQGDIEMREEYSGEVLTKYHIKKKYDNDQMQNYGQKISVLHPFSEGEYYDEYLINIDYVVGEFIKKKFIVVQNGTFADWLPKFKRFDEKKYNRMSRMDMLYSSLYSYVTLVKC